MLLLVRFVSVIGFGFPGLCDPLLRSCPVAFAPAVGSSLGFALVVLGAVCFCGQVRVSGVLRLAPAVVPDFPCSGVSSCGAALPSCPLVVSLSVSFPTSLISSPFWGVDCARVHTSLLMFRRLFSLFVCGFLEQCDYAWYARRSVFVSPLLSLRRFFLIVAGVFLMVFPGFSIWDSEP